MIYKTRQGRYVSSPSYRLGTEHSTSTKLMLTALFGLTFLIVAIATLLTYPY